MNRRNFMRGILAAAAAPAFVKFGSLMVPNTYINGEPRTAFISQIDVQPMLRIYSGAMPPTPDRLLDAKLLVEMALEAMPAKLGTLQFEETQSPVLNSGVASFFRLYSSSGQPILQGSCNPAGLGADMVLDNSCLLSGQTLTLTNFTLAAPERNRWLET